MAFSLDTVQEDIIAFIDAQFVQPLVEQGVPDISTVLRNESGDIEPYISFQFGDTQEGATRSMAGVRAGDYQLPIYFQCVAPEADIARRLSNKLTRVFLGETFPWAGSVRKRPGGGMWPLTGSNSATEAYLAPSSFGVLLELVNT